PTHDRITNACGATRPPPIDRTDLPRTPGGRARESCAPSAVGRVDAYGCQLTPYSSHSFSPIGGQAFSPEWGPPLFGRSEATCFHAIGGQSLPPDWGHVALAVLPVAGYCSVLWLVKDGGDLGGKESGRVGNS